MMITRKSVFVIANDNKMLFLSFLESLRDMSLSINLWGRIPKEQLKGLFNFLNTKGAIRKFRYMLFNEFQFDIKPQQHKEFIESCKSIDFSQLSWGVYKEDVVFALSREIDDINMTSNKYISIDQIQHTLEELKKKKIVVEYEIVDCDEEGVPLHP